MVTPREQELKATISILNSFPQLLNTEKSEKFYEEAQKLKYSVEATPLEVRI